MYTSIINTIEIIIYIYIYITPYTVKMEQILLAYGLPKETIAAIMMPYKYMKVKVRSPDGNKDFFDIDADVQREDILAPYVFIICLDKDFERW